MDFTAPTADQVLAIRVNAGIEELAAHPRFAAASPDMVEAIVEGIGQFAAGEFAPLNRKGDVEGARLANGTVTLPAGTPGPRTIPNTRCPPCMRAQQRRPSKE